MRAKIRPSSSFSMKASSSKSSPSDFLPVPKCIDYEIELPGPVATLLDPKWTKPKRQARQEFREITAHHLAKEGERPTPGLDVLRSTRRHVEQKEILACSKAKTNKIARERVRDFVESVEEYKTKYSISINAGDFEDIERRNAGHRKAETPSNSLRPSRSSSQFTVSTDYSDPSATPTADSFPRGPPSSYGHPASQSPAMTATPSMNSFRSNVSPSGSVPSPASPIVQSPGVTINLNHGVQDTAPKPPQAPQIDWPELRNLIAMDNLYDSGHIVRSSVPKLDPQTMDGAIGKLADWFSVVDKQSCIHWLYGPEGCGKTVVMQHVVEKCVQLGQPIAAFFFTEPADQAAVHSKLAPTLVHDIIRSMAQEKEYFRTLSWLRGQGSPCLTLRMDKQVAGLVDTAFKGLQTKQSPKPLLIALDGLEQCSTDALVDVFRLISSSIQRMPVCFLLASRPTKSVESFLNSQKLTAMTCTRSTELTLPEGSLRIRKKHSFWSPILEEE
ncbi:hypothetical protein DFP72DRAFT_1176789 [Ephemerocybe angulata]|uniref:Nephrocystin 3-like N-terminal domain-containing protein n=1 Tax=Ephemerocybe angulata TaxID=980116 RepID=A0A8H6HE98_9AGAR|nr:hypothetical protein DFP72DRAFT_1176789 [Tulosesus angulatus]